MTHPPAPAPAPGVELDLADRLIRVLAARYPAAEMLLRMTAIASLLVGCGAKRDCERYADKVAELSDPAPGRRASIVENSRQRCERGRIRDDELACVEKVTSREQLIACATGRPAVAPSDVPAVAPPKGTTAVTLVAAQNAGGFHPLDLDSQEDQRQWFAELKKEIAECATDEVHDPPQQYVVVVTFSPERPAVSPGGLPVPLSFCIKRVLSRRQPASVGNGPAEFFIDLGR